MADRHNIRLERHRHHLRCLAGKGSLARTYADSSARDRLALREAAYSFVWPIVFNRLTKQVERKRGHLDCSRSVRHLADGCLDAFHDDVEASVQDVLLHATVPIGNIEAWITSRLTAATIDAYRRRRGQRGALQRPRPPKWLVTALGHDTWLVELATQLLVWVGVEATAGASIWPVDSWAVLRAATTADVAASTAATVNRDIDTVLAAMRQRPQWYQQYVERPLGHKQPAVGAGPYLADAATAEQAGNMLSRNASDDGRLHELAAAALEAIEERLARGDDARVAVKDVVVATFGESCPDIERVPFSEDQGWWASALLCDATAIERLTDAVVDIVERCCV
jgi:hypothetical protein